MEGKHFGAHRTTIHLAETVNWMLIFTEGGIHPRVPKESPWSRDSNKKQPHRKLSAKSENESQITILEYECALFDS